MSDAPEQALVPSSLGCWSTYWRWEWFEQPVYIRDYQNHLSDLPRFTAALCKEKGFGRVVDAGCGFGLTMILLAREGLDVVGAETVEYCVNVGLRLTRQLGGRVFDLQCMPLVDIGVMHGFEFFDCVMFSRLNDLTTTEDMDKALRGVFDVLRPGGMLVWPGLPPESDEQSAADQLLLDGSLLKSHEMLSHRHRAEVKIRMTHLVARSVGSNYIDEHHLYWVEPDGQSPSLQGAVIRRPYYWPGSVMGKMLAARGFTDFVSIEKTVNGKTLRYNTAVRGNDAPD